MSYGQIPAKPCGESKSIYEKKLEKLIWAILILRMNQLSGMSMYYVTFEYRYCRNYSCNLDFTFKGVDLKGISQDQ